MDMKQKYIHPYPLQLKHKHFKLYLKEFQNKKQTQCVLTM